MRFRNVILASTLFLSAAAPAWSMGDNVVLIATSKVDLPSRLPGLCRVQGTISQVWEGKTFRAGQTLTVRVPCSGGNSYMTPIDARSRPKRLSGFGERVAEIQAGAGPDQ